MYKRDFPELEGLIIDQNVIPGLKLKVLGCCYEVGVTLVAADARAETSHRMRIEKGAEIFCANGPLSPNTNSNPSTYDREFKAVVRMIKRGHFDNNVHMAIINECSVREVMGDTEPTVLTLECAFK